MLTASHAVSVIGSIRTFIRGLHFFGPSPWEAEALAFPRPALEFLRPRSIQTSHSRETIRTTLERLGRLSRRRSSMVR